ncbi:MAG: T9SS type A sorting domain-containing protein [Bacteroidia bacterium]
MKNIYLFIFIVLSKSISAQIQITQSHMPSINDTIRYSNSNVFNYDYTLTGANYNWDFVNLNVVSQDIYKFQSLLQTPYSTLAFTGMPFGAIGYKVADSIGQGQAALKNIYNFYDKKSSGWSAVGTGFTPAAIPFPAGGVYKDKDEIYQFPLTYNRFDSSTFEVTTSLGTQPFQLGTFKQKGYRLNKVEGWGTITTPYGNTINCLKVKSTVNETDSLKVSTLSINVGFQVNRIEYKWLSTSELIPILEVTGTEINGTFTPSIVRYRDNYRNPSSGPLTLKANFTVNKNIGIAGIDTFEFTNTSTPNLGNTFEWTIQGIEGVRFVSNTSKTSTNPKVVFDSTGLFSVNLKASNFFGSHDTTFTNLITINKDNSNSIQSISPFNLKSYPNPFTKYIHFDNPLLQGKLVRVFDSGGRLILNSKIDTDLKINCEKLNSGIYTLIIKDLDILYYTQITKE